MSNKPETGVVLRGSEWLCEQLAKASTHRASARIVLENPREGTPPAGRLIMTRPAGGPNKDAALIWGVDLDSARWGPITLGDLSFFDEVSALLITDCNLEYGDKFKLPPKLHELAIFHVSIETFRRILWAATVCPIKKLSLGHGADKPSPMDDPTIAGLVAELALEHPVKIVTGSLSDPTEKMQ